MRTSESRSHRIGLNKSCQRIHFHFYIFIKFNISFSSVLRQCVFCISFPLALFMELFSTLFRFLRERGPNSAEPPATCTLRSISDFRLSMELCAGLDALCEMQMWLSIVRNADALISFWWIAIAGSVLLWQELGFAGSQRKLHNPPYHESGPLCGFHSSSHHSSNRFASSSVKLFTSRACVGARKFHIFIDEASLSHSDFHEWMRFTLGRVLVNERIDWGCSLFPTWQRQIQQLIKLGSSPKWVHQRRAFFKRFIAPITSR